MQDSCWLPLLPLAVPHLAASFDLPSSCSVSALRAAFRPFPFPITTALPAAALSEPTTIEEALMGRPVKRLRRCEEDTVLRELKRADVDAVKELHDDNLPLSYPSSFYTLLLTIPTSLCLIATRGSALLGAVSARLSPASFDPLSTHPSIYIISLVVSPSSRCQGLAGKLFREVLRALLDSFGGASKVQRQVLVTLHALPTMVPFYQKLRLEEVSRVRGYYRRMRIEGNGEAAEMRGLVTV